MSARQDFEYLEQVLNAHVAWGRERIEFWKHLVMIEATVLGLGAGLMSQRPAGDASLLIIATWWTMAIAIGVGCLLIWAQIDLWQQHEMFNHWSMQVRALIQAERSDGSSEAARFIEAYRDEQQRRFTSRLFPKIVPPSEAPADRPPPAGVPSLPVRSRTRGPLGWLFDTSLGSICLTRSFVGLSLAALLFLLLAISCGS